jgi:OPT oligopeptide transporter protein
MTDFGLVFQILFTMTTQLLGFGIGGLLQKWLVYHPAMIWPHVKQTEALLNTLHKSRNVVANGWAISPYRFLMLVSLISFLWYFVPGFMFPALSRFAVITWMFPTNILLNQLFGMTSGMSLLPITFDWAQIAGFIGSPLHTPWSTARNVLIGLIFWQWMVGPVVHFSNMWKGLYFPFNSYNCFVPLIIL